MKYFTKEWYEDFAFSGLYYRFTVDNRAEKYSNDYFIKLYLESLTKYLCHIKELKKEKITKKMLQDSDSTEYKKSFEEDLEWYKNNLPQNILKTVPDMRVLTLYHINKKTYSLLRTYCLEKQRAIEQVFIEYYDYYQSIESQLGHTCKKYFDTSILHDSIIELIFYRTSDLYMILNNTYKGDITFKFKNFDILLDSGVFPNQRIKYCEIYTINTVYEFHILTSSSQEFIFRAEDMIVISEN